jgi:hypothetical protein
MAYRFQNAFPNDPAKAFGKHAPAIKQKGSYDFPKNVEGAFRSLHQTRTPGTTEFDVKKENPGFDSAALCAFGKKNVTNITDQAFQGRNSHDGFSESASSAFGKKARREEANQDIVARSSTSPSPLPSSEWSTSALRSKKDKPVIVVKEEEEFPVLGSKKEEFPSLSSSKSKSKTSSPTISFATLVKKRAEDDEKEAEKLAIEEAKRLSALKRLKEEKERIRRSRLKIVSNQILNDAQPDDEEIDSEEDAAEEEVEDEADNDVHEAWQERY